MTVVLQVLAWVAAGIYFAVAAVGGSEYAAAGSLACGYFAGRAVAKLPKKRTRHD